VKAPSLVIAIPKGHGREGDDEDDHDMSDEDDGDAMEAFDTFADAIGVPEDKRQAAYEAFRAAVKACNY
jgi:hypothetical protein